MTIGSGLTDVVGSFTGCPALETVIIREGPTNLTATFFNCENIKNIYFPKSIVNIGRDSFNLCNEVNIWYAGSADDKEKIVIESNNNGVVDNATWHYNSKY